ncbi:hypothetical protein CHUAL_002411 [Chamberlinius hualienensis]
MWKCRKCGKPVYFAERKQSLGYDWHPECLRCQECDKRLNPGQHAEHKGEPYCYTPCYSVLFGPTLYGHGSQVETHTSFGKCEKLWPTGFDKAILEAKLKAYNNYYDGNSGQLKWKERNSQLTVEGPLHIYWGVDNLIHLKENDDQRHHVQLRKRYSCRDTFYKPRTSHNTQLDFNDNIGKSAANDNFVSAALNLNEKAAGVVAVDEMGSSDYIKKSVGEAVETEADKVIENVIDVNADRLQPQEDGEVNLMKNDENEGVMSLGAKLNESHNSNEENANLNSECMEVVERQCSAEATAENSPLNELNGNSTQQPLDAVISRHSPTSDSDVTPPTERRQLRHIDLSRVQNKKLTSSRSKTRLKRRCSINGHYYNRETKIFTPPKGSASNVWISSMVTTKVVINLLLSKFRIENNPDDFALFVVRDNGEIKIIKDDEYPLVARILLGPHEQVAKIYIMDRSRTSEVSNEVAQYLNFQEPELVAILQKFDEEEANEVLRIRSKFDEIRRRIITRLDFFRHYQ